MGGLWQVEGYGGEDCWGGWQVGGAAFCDAWGHQGLNT